MSNLINQAITTPSEPLGARLAEVVDYLRRERDELFGYVNSLPDNVLSQQPEPGKWSVAETLEHLVKIESGAGRLVSTLLKQVKAEDKRAQSELSIINCLDEYRIDEGNVRLEAPAFVRPTDGLSAATAMETLNALRIRLVEAIHKADGWDLGSVSYPHPFLGPITGYQWLVLIGKHEERHMKQIKNTVSRIASSTQHKH